MAFYWILQSYFLLCVLFVITVYTEEVSKTTPPNISTNFSCFNRPMGFYADVEANCRVYHTCDDHGNKFSYRCPEETAFRQDALICDHVHLVDCRAITYLSTQFQNENADKENTRTSSIRSPTVSIDLPNNHRHSLSRSFRVIQQPDKVKSNKAQSGFVFSASLFLRDKTGQNQAVQITDTCTTCNDNSKNRMTVSTSRSPITEQFSSWNSRNDKSIPPRHSLSLSSLLETRTFARDKNTVYLNRPFEPIANSSLMKMITPSNQRLSALQKSSFVSYNSDYHPYSETLKSIQANTHTLNVKSVTEIPVHALTLSLKPLVPNELEYDPYYPKQPTSTEAYYTPSNRNKVNSVRFNQTPPIIAHTDFFEIPSILPDLNTLEDLVDRRKFFYIPRANNAPL